MQTVRNSDSGFRNVSASILAQFLAHPPSNERTFPRIVHVERRAAEPSVAGKAGGAATAPDLFVIRHPPPPHRPGTGTPFGALRRTMHQYLGCGLSAGIVLAHQWMVGAAGSRTHFAFCRSSWEMPSHPSVESAADPPQSSIQNEIVVTELLDDIGAKFCCFRHSPDGSLRLTYAIGFQVSAKALESN